MTINCYFTREELRNDKNPVIQRALKVLEDSKSGHLVATREVIYYENFRKDVERSEARKRKIRKELAKLEQERRSWRRERTTDLKALDTINYNIHDINSKLSGSLVDVSKISDLDDRVKSLESTVNTLNDKKHYVSQLNTSVEGAELEIGRVKSEPVRLKKSTVQIVRNKPERSEVARNAQRKSDNLRSSGSETSSHFDQITGNNLTVGDLTDQVWKIRQNLSAQNAKIIEDMNRELAESEKKLATPDMPPPLRPSESSADLFKHLEELQNENENLSKTVEELTQRLMLHEEDSDDENVQEEHVFALSDSTFSNFETVIPL